MFSFTGNKASFWGSHNHYGKAGLEFYTQLQTITSSWRATDAEAYKAAVVMPTMK